MNKKVKIIKNSKKGQITLIIILILILIIGIVISINLLYNKKPRISKTNTTTEIDEILNNKVKNIIEECAYEETLEMLKKIGDQGTLKPKTYIASKNTRISYFYYLGEKYLPDKKEIENSISEKLEINLETCLNKKEIIFIDKYDPDIKTFFSENDLNIKISFNNKNNILFNGKKIELSEYYINIKTSLIKTLYKVKNFIEQINDEWLNIDELNEKDFNITIIKIDTYTWIYEIIDNKGLEDNSYKYRFAVKYNI